MVALASAVGLVLGVTMVSLNLLSVSLAARAPIPDGGDPLERRTKGSPSAPVVITEWFDYQCPACRTYSLSREPEIERLYVDTGKVRFVSRNLPFLGPESFLAAEAAECAADQGRYWAYRTLLFQRWRGENVGAYSVENLKRLASELGLDRGRFDACLDGGKYREAVLAEVREGSALGVRATPTFFINGRPISGVPSVERMGSLIEEELARRR